MKTKWKQFAVSQVLSYYDIEISPDELYDKIIATDDAGLSELFERYCVGVWQPFEHWPLTDVVELIVDLATRAEEIEGWDE